MNFTKEDKKRLLELLGKSELSDSEKKELKALQEKATKAGHDSKTGEKLESGDGDGDGAGDDGDDGMSEDDVKKIVTDSVKAAMTDLPESITMEQVTSAVEKALDDHAKAVATEKTKFSADKVKSVVDSAIKGLQPKQDSSALSKKDVEEIVGKALDGVRLGSKMQHDAGSGIDVPIAHRSGNMSVAQKQLLNICLMNASEDALAQSKTARPKGMNDGITDAQLKRASDSGQKAIETTRSAVRKAGLKALTTSGVGSGSELIATDLSSDLLMRLYLASELAAELVSQEIQMPTNPYEMPLHTTRPRFYMSGEGTAPSESNIGTAKPVLDAKKLSGFVDYSYEADEDSIIAMLPMLQQSLAESAAEALEDAIINGHTASTHMDSDVTNAKDHRKAYNGLRRLALAAGTTVDLTTGGVSATNIAALRKLMKKYGVNPKDVLILSGVSGYNDIVSLDETLTMEKVGAQARIQTGIAPSLYGMRVIVSSTVREDLNSGGVYDGSTTSKGSIILMHRPSFLVGLRRGFTLEVDRDIKAQLNTVVASFRRAFTPVETPSATVPSVVMGYNYTA